VLPPVRRDETSEINGGYPKPSVSIQTTRLSELTSPERLMFIHLAEVSLQGIANSFSRVAGDDKIVTIDANQPTDPKDGRPIERELILSQQSRYTYSVEYHRLNRKAESRSHRRKLLQRAHSGAIRKNRMRGSTRKDTLEQVGRTR